jgi:hypothetical protein
MTWGFTSETSNSYSSVGTTKTCWMTVAMIIGIIIFILIINDLCTRKYNKEKKIKKNKKVSYDSNIEVKKCPYN